MDLKQFLERYGIAVGVVVALVAVIAILPGNADDRLTAGNNDFLSAGNGQNGASGSANGATGTGTGTSDLGAGSGTGTDGGTGSATGTGGGSTAGGGSGGSSSGGATASGSGFKFGTGPDCDKDGRQKGITIYMPPCVQWEAGTDNGGSTYQGVTKDQVKVVRWLGQLDPATGAILQGAQLSDGRPKIKQTFEAIRRYSNNHYQTYNREVVFIDMDAGGPSEDDAAMKADAVKIAKEIKPFAVVGGDPSAGIPNVLARELAQLGVLCICTTSNSSQFYTELPPLIFGSLPTSTEYAANTAEYVAKKLWNKNAEFAGDEQLPTQTFKKNKRKFGLIYLEGVRGKVDPEGKRAKDAFDREFAKYGMHFDKESAYIYDPGRNQQDVTSMIAQMKGAGITTIVSFWDPLYPILITKEATRQQYFPEWFITGSGLSDTTAAGRLYDQQQWRHAFGISPLWVTWTSVPKSTGYREYKHGDPSGSQGEPGVLVNIYRAGIQTLFRGIHMAGPDLTNETFVRGELAYPPTGGQPRAPLVFLTREFPTEIKDWVEVWYKSDEQGPDERDQPGSGMVMKTSGGKRFKLG
ncbi:MAG: hypothetical protein QOD30_584, partial [Actinomycetota bacterium]|nr:hypothetical protein [Actinomycetota bacterium]